MGEVSTLISRIVSATRVGIDGGQRSDIDRRLLIPLMLTSVTIQAVTAIIRVTTTYRAIELNLPVVWIGVISAVFAILPIFLAVWVGRFMDRGKDAQALWIGSVLLVAACAGFWLLANSLTALLLLTSLFGIGHLFLMASQQMLCIRCAGAGGRDSVFGNYLVASAIGQGLGPYVISWSAGTSMLPPTGALYGIAFGIASVSLLTSAAIRPARVTAVKDRALNSASVRTLLRQHGLIAVLVASVITMTSQDLLTVYLPLLGADRGINASDVGVLLTVRSILALISRMGYSRVIRLVPRGILTLASMLGAGLGFACLALPIPLSAMYLAMAVMGFSLGIATTLSLTNVVDMTSSEVMGTVMSLRITGNRIGQVAVPFAASLIAAATGVAGIFVVIALSLALSGASVHYVSHDV